MVQTTLRTVKPAPHSPFGALVGNSTCAIQTDYFRGSSNKQAQGDVHSIQSSAFCFPQFPEYSNLVGWSSHHELEGIQTSVYMSGCYHGYHQSTINQSSTRAGQRDAARNNEGGFQDLRKQQYFPPSGS